MANSAKSTYFCFMRVHNWFAEWFDSPYYHLLYQHRDEEEAKQFIAALLNFLELPTGARLLDLACGKGRHALTMHQYGFEVVGADLSVNSIAEAQKQEKDCLKFVVHDMREVLPGAPFDAVFNLFTSFGYFDTMEENEKVLRAIHRMLKPAGLLIIDFLNLPFVLSNLVEEEEKQVGHLHFSIRRTYDGTQLYKSIQFSDQDMEHHHTERVQALRLTDFETLFQKTGFKLIHTFGDYHLNPYINKESDRLILIARKDA